MATLAEPVNFDNVRKYMEEKRWRWSGTIPSVKRLMACVEYLVAQTEAEGKITDGEDPKYGLGIAGFDVWSRKGVLYVLFDGASTYDLDSTLKKKKGGKNRAAFVSMLDAIDQRRAVGGAG